MCQLLCLNLDLPINVPKSALQTYLSRGKIFVEKVNAYKRRNPTLRWASNRAVLVGIKHNIGK